MSGPEVVVVAKKKKSPLKKKEESKTQHVEEIPKQVNRSIGAYATFYKLYNGLTLGSNDVLASNYSSITAKLGIYSGTDKCLNVEFQGRTIFQILIAGENLLSMGMATSVATLSNDSGPVWTTTDYSYTTDYNMGFDPDNNLVISDDNNNVIWSPDWLFGQNSGLFYFQKGIILLSQNQKYSLTISPTSSTTSKLAIYEFSKTKPIWELIIPTKDVKLRMQGGILRLRAEEELEDCWVSGPTTYSSEYGLHLDNTGYLSITDGRKVLWGMDTLFSTTIPVLSLAGKILCSTKQNYFGMLNFNGTFYDLVISNASDTNSAVKVGHLDSGIITILDGTKTVWISYPPNDFYLHLAENSYDPPGSRDPIIYLRTTLGKVVWSSPAKTKPSESIAEIQQFAGTFLPTEINFSVSDDRLVVTKTSSTSDWDAVAVSTTVTSGIHRWVLELTTTTAANFMIGIAFEDIDQYSNTNPTTNGWYFNCHTSTLYSGPPMNYSNYTYCGTGQLLQGSVVEIQLDMTAKTIQYNVYGFEYTAAYTGIQTAYPLRLVCILYDENDAVTLVSHTVY